MKTCPNCSQPNNDEAGHCQSCGTKFEVGEANQDSPKFDDPMPMPDKWRFWLGAWGLVVVATLVTNPASILAVPFFPIGLLDWLPHGDERAIEGWMVGAWVIGWIFYAFYLLLRNGREYGRMSINLFAPYGRLHPGLIRLSYAINPSGSRILR